MLPPQGGASPALTLPTKRLRMSSHIRSWTCSSSGRIGRPGSWCGSHSALSLSTVLRACYQVQETLRYDVPNEPNFVFAFLYVSLGELKLI